MAIDPRFFSGASNVLADMGYGIATGGFKNMFGEATKRQQEMEPGRDAASAAAQKEIEDAALRAKYAGILRSMGMEEHAKIVEDGLAAPGEVYMDALEQKRAAAAPPTPNYMTVAEGGAVWDENLGKVVYTNPKGGPDTVVNNNMGATDKFYDSLDAKAGESQVQLINDGLNAQSNNMRLGQIQKHLATAPQGAQGLMTQVAGSVGIDVGGLSDVQAAEALINQMVPGQRPPGSGTMSDRDLELFKRSLPAIVNQPGGNQYIIQTAMKINEYTIEQARIATMVANRQIDPAKGREMQAAIPNPLADFSAPSAAPAPGKTLIYNPETGELEPA